MGDPSEPKQENRWLSTKTVLYITAMCVAVLLGSWDRSPFSVSSQKREEANQAFMNANMYFKMGDSSNAIQQYRAAVQANPHHAQAWTNLGYVLSNVLPHTEGEERTRVYMEAVGAYNSALGVDPNFVEAHFNLGVLQQSVDRLDLAAPSYTRAVEINPGHYVAWSNLGSAKHKMGDLDGAVECYQQAIDIVDQMPEGVAPRQMRSTLYYLLGSAITFLPAGRCTEAPCSEHAAIKFRQALRVNPDNEEARHALSALVSDPTVTSASTAYIKSLFDEFAGTYDKALIQGLGYKAPQLLREAVGQYIEKGSKGKFSNVLDAGCGTGLCGPLFRNISDVLVGVDLSGSMIEKARLTGAYDELIVGDIGEVLDRYGERGGKHKALDLVISADVFVYFGDLSEVFKQVAGALRKGGLFGFTAERLDLPSKVNPDSESESEAPSEAEVTEDDINKGWKLRFSGRFAHTRDYVTKLAKAHDFKVVHHENIVPRKDHGKDIPGQLLLLELTM